MGRVPRKKVKCVGSEIKKLKNPCSAKKRRSRAISSHTNVKDNKTTNTVNGINKPNTPLNSSIEVIEIEDNVLPTEKIEHIKTNSSKIPISNMSCDPIDIIDITDITLIDNQPEKSQTAPSELKYLNTEDDIIDITEITLDGNEYKNSNTVTSNYKMPFCGDVQTLSHTACTQNNPIELITISDDSDEENTLIPPLRHHPYHQQSNEKLIGFKSIKERLGVLVNTKKRGAYKSPLRSHKKISKDEYRQQEILPTNLGAFVIDKQRISHHSQNLNQIEPKTTTSFQPHKSSSSTISQANRQLRPIIIDGLNIGHAHGSGTFSVKGIDLCVNYFANRGHKDIIAFIPQHRQGPPGSESNNILNALVKKGHICYTPSRKVQNLRMTCYDDRIILNYANQCGGVVVSNDNYRDLYAEKEAFKEIIEKRQVMVTFVRDEIIVPDDQYNRRHGESTRHVRSLSDILCFSE